MRRLLGRLDPHIRAFGAALLFGMFAYGFAHLIYWISSRFGE